MKNSELAIFGGTKSISKPFKRYNPMGKEETEAAIKVLKTGKISPGDSLDLIKKENNSMSIYEITDLLYIDIDNIDKMKNVIQIDSLTEEIKEKFRERLIKLGEYI